MLLENGKKKNPQTIVKVQIIKKNSSAIKVVRFKQQLKQAHSRYLCKKQSLEIKKKLMEKIYLAVLIMRKMRILTLNKLRSKQQFKQKVE